MNVIDPGARYEVRHDDDALDAKLTCSTCWDDAAPQPYDFKHAGHTYRLMLPAHFLTEQVDSRDYYVWLLSERLHKGYVSPDERRGILAGAYEWERIA